jgi:biopolymer transport protein TolQ
MKFFTGNALWALVKQSDLMSCLVLGSLLFMSIVCWAIAFYKWSIIRRRETELRKAADRLAAASSLEQLLVVGQSFSGTIAGTVITRMLARAKELLEEHAGLKKGLTAIDIDLLRTENDAVVNEVMIQEEQYMTVLKASAEVAPLLGLFGTIWGLIHSFMRISQEQSADIITVAPGIAEALITTLMGMVVAVPVLVLYHILQARLADMEHQIVRIADRCERIIQMTLHKS